MVQIPEVHGGNAPFEIPAAKTKGRDFDPTAPTGRPRDKLLNQTGGKKGGGVIITKAQCHHPPRPRPPTFVPLTPNDQKRAEWGRNSDFYTLFLCFWDIKAFCETFYGCAKRLCETTECAAREKSPRARTSKRTHGNTRAGLFVPRATRNLGLILF